MSFKGGSTSFDQIVENALLNEEVTREREKGFVRPSSLGLCPTKTWFQTWRSEEAEFDVATKLRFKAGHIIHDLIQTEIRKIQPGAIMEIPFSDPVLRIQGQFDYFDPETGLLVDIKTQDPRALKWKKKETYIPVWYKAQLGAYKHLIEANNLGQVKEARIYFVSLGLDWRLEIPVAVDEIESQFLVEIPVIQAVTRNPDEPPFPAEPRFPWECKRCPFSHVCPKVAKNS